MWREILGLRVRKVYNMCTHNYANFVFIYNLTSEIHRLGDGLRQRAQ